jgi:hypothetical protein
MNAPRRVVLLIMLVTALAAGGCKASVGIGDKEVAEADIEQQAADQLAAEVHQPAPDIDCPGPLKAEKGATLACVLSVKGDTARYPVTITATGVADGKVDFDAKVGDKPLP